MGPRPPRRGGGGKPPKIEIVKSRSGKKGTFDPTAFEKALVREARKNQDWKDVYRGDIKKWWNKGGKISKYYKDGGMVITGRD